MALNKQQQTLCDENTTDFSDLKAVLINTSLKQKSDESHTKLLMGVSGDIMAANGIAVEHIHMLDHQVSRI
mgnify:FL=1